ncbi:COG4705 family protein [Acinetobacter brisouii]|uniref:COG4705 family protein n=1 Tax=Acinetobacter brisouii TaxID=396323 RepID=UPI0005F825E5|nr:membrane protein [Acinetobacter brisouii]KJV37968.1 membrane protein [Acinetobacter brisouii]
MLNKVPQVTLIFWMIKIAATTLGETAGDALSMSLDLGYILSSAIFFLLFAFFVSLQIKAKQYHPYLYWLTIITTTTLGTTIADFVDRSLGIGYFGGSLLLLSLLLCSLAIWYYSDRSLSVQNIRSTKTEMFYWVTIMFSQTLGTALGDWVADTQGLGYLYSAIIFGSMLLLLTLGYFWTKISHTFLFWSAFILTRPLGAVLGDFLDKPISHGGLDLSRFGASFVLIVLMFIFIFISTRASKANT